jgi:ubiquinone biosynthesis protein
MIDPALVPSPLVPPGERAAVVIVEPRRPSRFRGTVVVWRLLRWAGGAAWQRARGRWDAGANARAVRRLLEDLGGLWIKVGQLLSLRVDVFSVELCRELTRLQDSAPGFPAARARRIVEGDLGMPLEEVFDHFDDHPIAAASIGQVHKARLRREGRWVAVKVRRPWVEQAFAREAALARRWVRVLEWLGVLPFMQWRQMQWELDRILQEELDYRVEGAAIARMRRTLAGHGMYVPEPFRDYTCERVLVMELVTGVQMSDYISTLLADEPRVRAWERENGVDPARVVRRFSHSILRQILEDNLFHGDLHPGNVVLLRNSRVALLDFGTVGTTERAYLDRFRAFMEHLIRDRFETSADLALMMSGALPADADLARARADVVRELRAWRARTGVAALPYPLKSVDAVNVAITKVLFRQRITFEWAFLRIRRALATMDASAMHLYPAANYTRITAAYFRRAARRCAGARDAASRGAGIEAWSRLPEQLAESAELMADIQRRQVRSLGRATEHATLVVGAAVRLLTAAAATAGAVGLLAWAGRELSLPGAERMPSLDWQLWALGVGVAVYWTSVGVRLSRAFSGREGPRATRSAALVGIDGRPVSGGRRG